MRFTMRENCFIDTSVILKIIIENKVELLEGLSKYTLHTSTNVLEETSFKIIITSVLEEMNVEGPTSSKLKRNLKKVLVGKL